MATMRRVPRSRAIHGVQLSSDMPPPCSSTSASPACPSSAEKSWYRATVPPASFRNCDGGPPYLEARTSAAIVGGRSMNSPPDVNSNAAPTTANTIPIRMHPSKAIAALRHRRHSMKGSGVHLLDLRKAERRDAEQAARRSSDEKNSVAGARSRYHRGDFRGNCSTCRTPRARKTFHQCDCRARGHQHRHALSLLPRQGGDTVGNGSPRAGGTRRGRAASHVAGAGRGFG